MTDIETKATEPHPTSFVMLGRTIEVKPLSVLNEGQRLGLLKVFRRYQEAKLDAAGTLKLDQALSKLLSAEDNDWLDYQIMEAAVAWPEVLVGIVGCMRASDAAPAQAPAVKAPRVRKVAAKKAVARKTAKRA